LIIETKKTSEDVFDIKFGSLTWARTRDKRINS
jgi:hypothetical protein